MILKIPLSHNTCEDFVSWEPNREGIFTVKSAYIFAKSEKFICFSVLMGREEPQILHKLLKTGNTFGR